jgi:hypothetical protein
MIKGIGVVYLAAAIVTLSFTLPARAGDPAIEDPNGLFSLKLGYQRAATGSGDQIINGTGVPGINFQQCPNNNCLNEQLFRTEIFGNQGIMSGFAGYGGTQGALPLGHDFGAQFDGELGGFDASGGGDATLHLFRADPAIGLVGPMVSYRALGDAGYLRAGGEAQYYWGDLTIYGNAAYQWANDGNTLTVDSGLVGCGYLAYYPMDSLMLLAGGGGGAGEGAGFGQIEWQPFQQHTPGLSLYVEGMAGTDSSAAAFAGVQFHFGAGHSLEMRHRHELPLRNTACGIEQFNAGGATVLNIFANVE